MALSAQSDHLAPSKNYHALVERSILMKIIVYIMLCEYKNVRFFIVGEDDRKENCMKKYKTCKKTLQTQTTKETHEIKLNYSTAQMPTQGGSTTTVIQFCSNKILLYWKSLATFT